MTKDARNHAIEQLDRNDAVDEAIQALTDCVNHYFHHIAELNLALKGHRKRKTLDLLLTEAFYASGQALALLHQIREQFTGIPADYTAIPKPRVLQQRQSKSLEKKSAS